MPIKTYTLSLKWAEMITPYVRHLAFERSDGHPFEFVPGQFITVLLPWESKILRRSYSVATLPGQSNLIEFAASFVPQGRATECLFNLKPGDQLNVFGPVGKLVLPTEERPKRYILVATGTGVTPYRSMLPELANRCEQGTTEVVILQGVQKRQDRLYADDFIAYANKHPHLDYRVCYSRESDEQLQAHECKGYVQTQFQSLQLNPEEDIVYLCGNPDMIDEAFAFLKEQGFSPRSVRREKYISSN